MGRMAGKGICTEGVWPERGTHKTIRTAHGGGAYGMNGDIEGWPLWSASQRVLLRRLSVLMIFTSTRRLASLCSRFFGSGYSI